MTSDLSEPHRLVVHDHPEDGFEILHPASCERHEGDWGGGITFVSYECMVSWHVDAVGLDFDVMHIHGDGAGVGWSDPYVLLPGTYRLQVEVLKIPCYECIGGYEYDSAVHVEPLPAITTGPIRYLTAPGGWCAPILPACGCAEEDGLWFPCPEHRPRQYDHGS